jgi:acyl transferase domain-containing protein/acyl carrier protein
MTAPESIAVVGMACRFPGANTPDELWQNLSAGIESITFFTPEELQAAGAAAPLGDPRHVPAKGVIDQADGFDAGFFGFSPREAALMDPQQRVFLETAWSALEDAGYDSKKYAGPIGVFAGSILSVYLVRNLWPNRDAMATAGNFQIALGNDPTFLATSTSYQLDLRGPSVSVGTACSTSLVAVHLASQSLLAFESDMALAGGVSVHLPLVGGYRYEDGGILSPDGHCRPFDAAAQGTVSSDGAGVVVLKRLSDAIKEGDTIHAVIRGSAMNNDGRMKVGYTAPSGDGESRVIGEALAMAGVEPNSISMIETHGAGTLLGDPIEVAALIDAFGDCAGKRQFCALGSVKSNIGHVDAAAGIAGFIKTVLALRHRQIPPTLHFEQPNPRIDFRDSPFYVNRELRPMSGAPSRAGVSSFGIGGTNVHVVLEEAPAAVEPQASARPFDLIMLSARTPAALDAATGRLADHLDTHPDVHLADAAFTLRHGRRAFSERRFVVASDRDDAIAALRDPQRIVTGSAPSARPSTAFMFPGLGDHYAAMGWEMYCTEPSFRESIDRSAALLKNHLPGDIRDFLYAGCDWAHPKLEPPAKTGGGLDLRAMLGKKAAAPDDHPAAAQPAIFVTEVALAGLLQSWGIEPEAMIGHSIGEFTAAHLSGVLSLPDAIEVVATRAQLIQSRVGHGAMIAVPLSEEELTPLLPAGVSLGAVNAPKLCIASGEEAGIAELSATLAAREVSCQRLRSTHAYHSAMMESIVEPLGAVLSRVALHAPRIPYVSCITGTWITEAEATDPSYWARHLCRTVNFSKGLSTLLDDPDRLFLEAGPGQGLTSHAIAQRRPNAIVPAMRWSYGLQSELAVLLRGVGQLWLAGAALDTARFLARPEQRRVPLPAYPFERRRYWIDPPSADAQPSAQKKSDIADWFYLPCWKPSVRARRREDLNRSWLIIADQYGIADDLAQELRARGGSVEIRRPDGLTIEAPPRGEAAPTPTEPPSPHRVGRGRHEAKRSAGEGRTSATMESPSSAFGTFSPARGGEGLSIVHLASLTSRDDAAPSAQRFAEMQELGYHSIVDLLRVADGSAHIEIVTNHVDDVPEKATLRAPAMVAPQEHPNLVCRMIETDLDIDRRDALVAQILDEITSAPDDSLVAYRHGSRFVPAYQPVALDAAPSALRSRGVYLITGGLGGVGMLLARHLAERAQARLILVGRSAPSDAKVREIAELEAFGAEVLVAAADVSNRGEMQRVLAAADERFGALHGVIHAAGAVGAETFREIREATRADSESQFVAKVKGVLVLDELLADRHLDFCLLMSSLSAILGGLGFSAYSAANLFMDAFSRWKNRDGAARWTSLDWDSWRLTDTRPVISGLGATVSEFVMEPREGVEAFERILAAGNLSQVIVSTGDLDARLRQWIGNRDQANAVPVIQHERPSLRTAYEAPRGEIERELASIWQELFGISTVGINDNFFELGGHSLLATQLNARLSSKLHVEMSLAALLQAPTIAELGIAVVAHQMEMADPALLEMMLAEVGEMSGSGDE